MVILVVILEILTESDLFYGCLVFIGQLFKGYTKLYIYIIRFLNKKIEKLNKLATHILF